MWNIFTLNIFWWKIRTESPRYKSAQKRMCGIPPTKKGNQREINNVFFCSVPGVTEMSASALVIQKSLNARCNARELMVSAAFEIVSFIAIV